MENIRITENDLRLVAAFHLCSDKPLTELSAMLGWREHRTRYRLQRLKEAGIVRHHPFIDVYKLGLIQFEIYLTLSGGERSGILKLERLLTNSELVPWIGEFAGAYQYAFTVCARHPLELGEFFDHAAPTLSQHVFKKSIATRISYTEFALKSFVPHISKITQLRFGGTVQHEIIDELDHKILKFMCRENEVHISRFAERANLPISSVHLRIAQLRKKGIYLGGCAIVDFAKIGFSVFKLLISVKQLDKRLKSRVYNYALNHKNIQYLVDCYGNWDFELGVVLRDPSQINELLQDLYKNFASDILHTQTLSSFSYKKVLRYPFDELPE